MIYYYVSAQNPNAHIFNIRLVITKPDPNGQQVSMPSWIPGSYLIRDFSRHLIKIDAFAGEEGNLSALSIEKVDSDTWQCAKTDSQLVLDYTVYAWDASVRGAHLDATHAFFNGCALFLMVKGQENIKCRVKLSPPNAPDANHWRVATTLTRESASIWGYGWYEAECYDELIDHPVEMGHFEIQEFLAGNKEHYIVVSGRQDGDLQKLTTDVKKICEYTISLFENHVPFEQYLFLLTVLKEGYGGLEHRSSSALVIQRDALPVIGDESMSRSYINLLGLFSHEYFHTWNVKRIKPEVFIHYHLNDKNYTRQLWAFEGITSYYDELILIRSGLITLEQYLDLLSQTITKVLRSQGRKIQTIVESSFDAWIKYYQPNENSSNATVNYYLKGSLVALVIDLSLRIYTQNNKSLDDVLKLLWSEYGRKNIGVPEGMIENIIQKMCPEYLPKIIYEALYTTEELPLLDLLTQFGLILKLREGIASDDLGGKKMLNPLSDKSTFKQGVFGITLSKNQGKVMIATVSSDSAAMEAGLSAQDEMVAVNELRIDSDSFDKICKRFKVGQQVRVHVFRQDILKEFHVTLKAPPLDTVEIVVNAQALENQKSNLSLWLSI